MHPISFTKAHPVGVLVSFAAGMMVGPWLFNMLNTKTGISVSLPSYGNGGG